MIRRQDLWSLGMDASIAHPDLVHFVHQLADKIKAKAGLTKSSDSPLWCENNLGVFDCVLKVILTPHRGCEHNTIGRKRLLEAESRLCCGRSTSAGNQAARSTRSPSGSVEIVKIGIQSHGAAILDPDVIEITEVGTAEDVCAVGPDNDNGG